jgi:hypothetical protein
MLQSPADALLEQDGGPLLGRRGNGSIIVRQELEIITTILDRECVLLEQGHLSFFE